MHAIKISEPQLLTDNEKLTGIAPKPEFILQPKPTEGMASALAIGAVWHSGRNNCIRNEVVEVPDDSFDEEDYMHLKAINTGALAQSAFNFLEHLGYTYCARIELWVLKRPDASAD
jgi:hypothetical protein